MGRATTSMLAGVVDRQRDDARVVAGVGLRHAVDQEQRVGELVADAWHAAEEHRLEDAELGGDEGPRHVLHGFGEALIAAAVHRLAVDDRRRRRREVADAQRRLPGRDLDALHEVGRHVELDGDRCLCSEIGDTHSEISWRSHDDCYRAGLTQLETTDTVCRDRVGPFYRHCGIHDWLTRRTSDDGAAYHRLALDRGGALGRSKSNNHTTNENQAG